MIRKERSPRLSSRAIGAIVAVAMDVLARSRKLGDVLEEIQIPRQDLAAGTVKYEKRRVIRPGLAERFDIRKEAARVGSELARVHDIRTLASDAGPVPPNATQEELAGLRFLSRLVDSAVAGRKAFPRSLSHRLTTVARVFESQIAAGSVEAEWVHPILGGYMPDGGVTLARGVWLGPMQSRDVAELARYELGFISGPLVPTLLLHTGAMLCIRRRTKAPGALYHNQEGQRIIFELAIAAALSGIRPLHFVNSWVRPVGPSVFAVQGAQWAMGSYPLVPQRRIERTELAALSRSFRTVQACPEVIRSSLPVQRLVSASFRSSPIDALVDIWVGLEAVLLSKEENTELQYRMSLRAARLLRASPPRAFIRRFKDAYADRSKVVHGSGAALSRQQLERLEWSAGVLRSLVRLAVKDGMPADVIALENDMLLASARRTRSIGAEPTATDHC